MYTKEIAILPSLKAGYHQFYDPNHPLAYSNGCVYFHRHVISMRLGRWLKPSEQVHHINGNKLDNSKTNLEVLTATEHAILHLEQNEKLLHVCKNCGVEFTPLASTVGNYCSRICTTNHAIHDKNITKELLDSLIPNNSWRALGVMFGYSDNGIKKRAVALGCAIPKRKRSSTTVT